MYRDSEHRRLYHPRYALTLRANGSIQESKPEQIIYFDFYIRPKRRRFELGDEIKADIPRTNEVIHFVHSNMKSPVQEFDAVVREYFPGTVRIRQRLSGEIYIAENPHETNFGLICVKLYGDPFITSQSLVLPPDDIVHERPPFAL